MKYINKYADKKRKASEKPERRFAIDRNILLDYLGKDKILKIPYGVKKIGKYSVWGLDAVKKVILPPTVKKIDDHAFFMCGGLKEINIENVKKIGKSAFGGCKKLKRIVIPEGVEKICENTFDECKSLEEAILPSTLKIIGESAFFECRKLKRINLPRGLQAIGAFAFCDCTKITGLYIPETVKTIGKLAFCDCRLKTVELPDTCLIEDENSEPFGDRAKITRYHGESNADGEACQAASACEIVKGVLAEYGGDKHVFAVPDGVTEIGELAFDNSRVRKVILPESVKIIADDAFCDSTCLKEINLPEGLLKLGAGAFQNCAKLKRIAIPRGITEIGEYTFSGCEELEEIILPEGISKIGARAFNRCKKLAPPKIPEGAEVDPFAFENTV